MRLRNLFLFVLPFFPVACGGLETDFALNGAQTIIIEDYTFTPTEITAVAGERLFFYNADTNPHQILSESDNDLFDASGVFDTSVITTDEFGVVVVPDTALPGDLIFFYDAYYKETMTTPSGVIVVE